MANGIALVDFCKSEALRMFEAGMTDPDLLLAETERGFIGERGSLAGLRCVYTFGQNAARDKATATRVISILEDHRWVERVRDAVIDGRKVRDAWRLRG